MASKRDWVDYTNLTANLIQTAQLDGIKNKVGELTELEGQRTALEQQRTRLEADRNRLEQDRDNRELEQDSLRNHVFNYDQKLREVKAISDSGLRLFYAVLIKLENAGLQPNILRSYEDKERIVSIQTANDVLIAESKGRCDDKNVDRLAGCATYAVERDDLLKIIEVQTQVEARIQELVGENETSEIKYAAQVAALNKELEIAKQEMHKTPPSFWFKVFGWRTPSQKQVDLINKRIADLQPYIVPKEHSSLRQKARAGLVTRQNSHLYKKFGSHSLRDYQEMVQEGDIKLKHVLGEQARSIIRDDNYFDNLSPPISAEMGVWIIPRHMIGGVDKNEEYLLKQCIDVIRSERKASIKLLHDRLSLRYGEAARFMDELEKRGIVGYDKESGLRAILIDLGSETSPQGPLSKPIGKATAENPPAHDGQETL